MKCEGDERGGIEGGFRTAQIPFEAFAVLRLVELKRLLNLKRERRRKRSWMRGKGNENN